MSPPVLESRLPVGSSANSTVGLVMSERAIATRCCCPPDISAGRCDSRSARPTLSTSCSSQASSTFAPEISSGSTMFSRAVSMGSRLKNWKMKPTCLRRSFVSGVSSSVVISMPSISTVPEVGLSSPAGMCMRVDLPEPEGPMIAVRRPAGTSSETLRRASTDVSPSPKRRVRLRASTTGPGTSSNSGLLASDIRGSDSICVCIA